MNVVEKIYEKKAVKARKLAALNRINFCGMAELKKNKYNEAWIDGKDAPIGEKLTVFKLIIH